MERIHDIWIWMSFSRSPDRDYLIQIFSHEIRTVAVEMPLTTQKKKRSKNVEIYILRHNRHSHIIPTNSIQTQGNKLQTCTKIVPRRCQNCVRKIKQRFFLVDIYKKKNILI